MKHATFLRSLLAALLVLLVAAPLAGAEAATAAKEQRPAATTTKGSDAKAEEEDGPSAAERRAADSEFESERLDQGAFDEAAEKQSGADAEQSGGGGSVVRMVIGLIVVLGAIYGVHWLLKRWGASRMQGVAGRTGVIDVVATTSLAQGRALHLVRIGEELVLVGATEQSITRIGDFDPSVLAAATAGDQGSGEFQAALTGAMYGEQPALPVGTGSGTGSTDQPFLRRFVDNLRMSTAR